MSTPGPLFDSRPPAAPYEHVRLQMLHDHMVEFKHGLAGQNRNGTPRPKLKRGEAKDQILRMAILLDHARPRDLPSANLGGVTLAEMVTDLVALQTDVSSPDVGRVKAQSERQLTSITQRMHAMRAELLPRRRGFNPAERQSLLKMNHGRFFEVARALVTAADEDRADPDTRNTLTKLFYMNDQYQHTKHMLAMLDLGGALDKLHRHYSKSPALWRDNLPQIQQRLQYMVQQYATHQPDRYTPQQDLADTLAHLPTIERPEELETASQTLRWYPTRYARRILEETAKAYFADQDALRKSKEHTPWKYDQFMATAKMPDRMLDEVYKARWALMADKIEEYMHRYFTTIADPEQGHEPLDIVNELERPTNRVSAISPLTSKRGPQR